MTSVWTMFAKTPEAIPAESAITDGIADTEFSIDAAEALPAHVEEFLSLKASAAF